VGCLLLIVCINFGGLLIVRASARTHESAIRAALGASAARLRRQTLAEALPLSAAGAGGGALLALGLLKVLTPWLPAYLPGLESIGLHGPALAFALALSMLVVLLAGMLPARLASRVQLAGTMQQDSRTVSGGGAIRNALVAAQIALTLSLVFACGLVARHDISKVISMARSSITIRRLSSPRALTKPGLIATPSGRRKETWGGPKRTSLGPLNSGRAWLMPTPGGDWCGCCKAARMKRAKTSHNASA
jgi:FtsX-like permease family